MDFSIIISICFHRFPCNFYIVLGLMNSGSCMFLTIFWIVIQWTLKQKHCCIGIDILTYIFLSLIFLKFVCSIGIDELLFPLVFDMISNCHSGRLFFIFIFYFIIIFFARFSNVVNTRKFKILLAIFILIKCEMLEHVFFQGPMQTDSSNVVVFFLKEKKSMSPPKKSKG